LPFVEELSKLPSIAILLYMLVFLLSFGLISNFVDNEGFMYNLFQGVFISVVTGAALILAKYLSRRRIAGKIKMQTTNAQQTQI
jgi:uncharacterized membrane protein